jgi:PIN domain nuclease of toxin-antitoxin system
LKYLIDTGVWLWLLSEPEKLSRAVLQKFDGSKDDFFLSSASVWEISIKWSKGKLSLPEPPATHVPNRMFALGVRPLPISQAHALAVAALPAHHHDPFDRLLIAQAQTEDMTLISADREFEKYSVKLLWAGR